MEALLQQILVGSAGLVEDGRRFPRAVAMRADPDLPVLCFSLDDGIVELALCVRVDLHAIESRPSIPGMSGVAVDV